MAIQDGMSALLKSCSMSNISSTKFPISEEGVAYLPDIIGQFRERIMLRSERLANIPKENVDAVAHRDARRHCS